jgi:hypothetical protein
MAIRWYEYLSGNKGDSLLGGAVDIANELFIGKQYTNKEGEKKYKYAVFSDTYDFWEYMLKTSEENRTFNEVSPALRAQKLRFDIDIDNIYDINLAFRIIGYLIAATIIILLKYNVILDLEKDVLIFNSNYNGENKKKTSYHIIIDNYSFANFHVIAYLASLIFEYVPNSLISYVDKGILTRNHMLRIYRNIKVNEAFRIKRLTTKWIYRKTLIETIIPHPKSTELDSDYDFYILEHSLITWNFYCTKVPVLIPLPPAKEITVNDKGIEYAISLYEEFDKEGIYHIDESRIDGNFIPLNRNFPAYCKICNREHNAIGAYLYINEIGIYFKCWRDKENKIKLGDSSKKYLEDEIDEESEEDDDNETPTGKLLNKHGSLLMSLSELAGNYVLKSKVSIQ